ncbi:MAG: tagaturonate reductase [Clostridia bacterium]|nr:tagaturonate reductase [Clostridia bacterium]
MKETILQFGTGKFLRAFADVFVDSLNKQGLYDGKVVIVSPTDSKTVDLINAQHGDYHLILRGLEHGKAVSETAKITSVTRAVNPYRDFDAFMAIADNSDLRFIVSNTTEAGIRFDSACKFDDRPAASFPGKLTQFLFRRYQKGRGGLVVLSCELIENNGNALKDCVLRYAEQWNLGDGFLTWLGTENRFCNTLVDRIVTGYPAEDAAQIFSGLGCRDALLDTAEPYHLWVIEGDFEAELPLKRGGVNVIWTDDAAPYKKMKVRILNGSHTSLVFPSLLCGVESVGESLKDGLLNTFLHTCLFEYILPTLGKTEETEAFAAAVLERFGNPYIRHLWRSIALNSVSKYTARVLPTVLDYRQAHGTLPKPPVFSLACLLKYYQENDPADDAAAIDFIKTHDVPAVLSNTDLWGANLGDFAPLVNESLAQIKTNGIREAIQWSLS